MTDINDKWPVGARVAVFALVLTALAEVVALTAYVVADAERQRSLEAAFEKHVTAAETQVIPTLATIRVELRAINVRLDYLETRLESHDNKQ